MDASLVFDIDSSQARGAAKALADLNSAVIKTANSASKFEKTLRASNGQFQSTGKYLRDNIDEIESLAKAYNPLLAAQIRYRDESIRTGVAVKAGVITEQQRIEILQRTKVALDASANAAQRFGQSQEIARHHVANLSFQLNDIGMMMATGQNPFMLMMQQGPQVAQIIGQMNQEGRKLGPTLAGAFKMFLNPTTAVTLALIGGSAALGQWAMAALGADSSAKTLEDTMDDLSSAIGRVEETNKLLASRNSRSGIEDMIRQYGRLTSGVWGLIEAQNRLAKIEAVNAQNAAKRMLEETFEPGFLATIFDNGRVAITEAEREAQKFTNTAKGLQQTLGIAQEDAEGVARTLMQAFDTKDPEEYIRLISHVRDYLIRVAEAGGEGAKEAARIATELTESEDSARRLLAQAGQIPGALDAAARAAARITDELDRAISSAAKLAMSGIQDVQRAEIELEFRTDPVGRARALAALQFDSETVTVGYDAHLFAKQRSEAIEAAGRTAELAGAVERLNEADREAERLRKKAERDAASGDKSSARKAAAELRSAEKGFQSLRELMEKESLFQFAEYDKRQAQLDAALSKRLLSEREYQKVSDELRTMYFGSAFEIQALNYQLDQEALQAALDQKLITEQEYYRKRKEMYWANLLNEDNRSDMAQDLSNTAQYFGQLTALTGNSYDTLGRLQKSFAASAALVNAYLAASQTLADPTLGFWAKMAAYGKVLAAGLGLVGAIKGGGKSGGGSASSGAATQAQKEPTKYVTINWDGPDWMRDGINGLLDEIYQQSADGRVIIAQERR